jgi:hypothetical protein
MDTVFNARKAVRRGAWISLLIGAPVGVSMVLVVFGYTVFLAVDSSGEGLPAMAIFGLYGYPTFGLIIAFLFALWGAGKRVVKDISEGRNLLNASFRYSKRVNLVIWTVFMSVTFIYSIVIALSMPAGFGSGFSFLSLVPPIIAAILCTLITPFTIGLLICYIISRSVKVQQTA